MNDLIWFLTDTNFSEEWDNSSLFGKISLIYTTLGILLFEILSLIFIFNVLINFLEVIF